MHITNDEVKVRMRIPGAVIRQSKEFGGVKGFDKISGEYFTLSAGVDVDAEILMFSPEHEHSVVIDHMIEKAKA